MLNTSEHDECCSPALNAAFLAGLVDDTEEWTHEECGTLWRAQAVGEVRHWRPSADVLIFR